MNPVDTSQYTNKSLEELRAGAERQKKMFTSTVVKNEAEQSYWDKVQKLNDENHERTLDEVLEEIKQPKRRKEVRPICNYGQGRRLVWEIMKAKSSEFGFEVEVNNDLKALMPMLVSYFTGNRGELDLNKGLYLWGPCGSGKTFLMRVFQAVAKSVKHPRMFKISSCPQIYDNILETEKFNLNMYFSDHRCFDDAGFDPPVIKHYGNAVKPMEIIMTHRYNNFVKRGVITHMTSNLPFKSSNSDLTLANRFDDRIVSRMHEMFNFVLLKGQDYRKK